MRNRTLLASATLFAAMPAAGLAAPCEPVFRSANEAVAVRATIAAGSVAIEPVQLRIGNDGTGSDCTAIVRLARINSAVDPDFPPYTIRSGGSAIEILPDESAGATGSSDIFVDAPRQGDGRNVNLRVRVPTDWGLKAGTFVDRLRVMLYKENGTLADTADLRVRILIPETVSVRLVGEVVGIAATGPATVNLGDLSRTADTRSPNFGARVFSTAPYSVSLVSTNGGNLLNENGYDTIAYRLYFDEQLVDLAGGNLFSYGAHTPSAGAVHPLRIVVPAAISVAGRYSDRVTLFVSAT